ncbi:hypothetical protein ANO11243_034550 [Dothideomycetidae sp. 11243]|nr:hypothetical protein ANO11243_034550 [fungal sp. No.11243]
MLIGSGIALLGLAWFAEAVSSATLDITCTLWYHRSGPTSKLDVIRDKLGQVSDHKGQAFIDAWNNKHGSVPAVWFNSDHTEINIKSSKKYATSRDMVAAQGELASDIRSIVASLR